METCCIFEEDQHRLCQLMVLNGFLSNPDIPGTEKLCVSVAEPTWLASPKMDLEVSECGMPDDGIAPPESFFFVKGWSRSVCCLAVLWFSFKSEEFRQARNLIFTASWNPEIPSVSSLPTTQNVCLYQIGAFVGRLSQKMSGSLFAKHRCVDVNGLGYNLFFSYHVRIHTQINFFRSFSTIFATVVAPDTSQLVNTNRGAYLDMIRLQNVKTNNEMVWSLIFHIFPSLLNPQNCILFSGPRSFLC